MPGANVVAPSEAVQIHTENPSDGVPINAGLIKNAGDSSEPLTGLPSAAAGRVRPGGEKAEPEHAVFCRAPLALVLPRVEGSDVRLIAAAKGLPLIVQVAGSYAQNG